MTQTDFIEEIRRLSVADRVALIEAISRSLREDLTAAGPVAPPPVDERTSSERRLEAVRRLKGVLRTGGPPPTAKEWKEDYVKHLEEKYS